MKNEGDLIENAVEPEPKFVQELYGSAAANHGSAYTFLQKFKKGSSFLN